MLKGRSVPKLLRRSVQTGRASTGAWLLSEDHECHLQHSPQPHAAGAAQHPLGTNSALKLWATGDQVLASQGLQWVNPSCKCSGLAKSQT